MFNASTSDACIVRAAFQPTMRRENTSTTNATYTIPDHVEQYREVRHPLLVWARRGEVTLHEIRRPHVRRVGLGRELPAAMRFCA